MFTPIDLADKSKDFVFSCVNVCSRIYYLKDFFKYNKILMRNAAFRDKYKGEKCFIICNGPSIKNLELDKVKGKNIFTVNAMLTTELFDYLKPTFHLISDRKVYARYKESVLKSVENERDTTFFFHRSICKDIGLKDNVFYNYGTLIPSKKGIYIDQCKNTNTFMNVPAFGIMLAMYMGFSEIVLLGFDFSFFASRKDSHFYDSGMSIDRKESLWEDLFGSSIAWQQYYYLYNYANNHGVKIVNATPGSLMDIYPQVDLDDCV